MGKFLENAAVYCGTYHKYNAGRLFGKWMKLADYADKAAFIAACRELHKDESDPELMFQDFEGFPVEFYSESGMDGRLWEIDGLLMEGEVEAFETFLRWRGVERDETAEEMVDRFREAYVGAYASEEDFAEECLNTSYDIPRGLSYYIDYGAYARDLFMGDYYFNNGFVFLEAA